MSKRTRLAEDPLWLELALIGGVLVVVGIATAAANLRSVVFFIALPVLATVASWVVIRSNRAARHKGSESSSVGS